MEEESKRRIAQMCYEIVNMISEGKTVEDINNNDDYASCDGIDCVNCPLYEARNEFNLYSCMNLTKSQMLCVCENYLKGTDKSIINNIVTQAKRLTTEEMQLLINKLLELQ